MSATLGQLRLALQTVLESHIDGLTAHATWPGQITPPAALVRPTVIEYSNAFDQLTIFRLEVVLMVRYANLQAGQDELDDYASPLGASSVQVAIEEDQTLGGLSQIVSVERMHDYGDIMVGQTPYLGAIFDVTIHAT